MLAKLFNIKPEFRRERRDAGNGHIEITSVCIMLSRISGQPVGEGAGICSTMESKFRWRKAQRSCPTCGVEGGISRSKFPPKDNPSSQPGWYCKECKAQFGYDEPSIRSQQCGRTENPDIADTYNTVQKMADKRAYVAAVITTVGASDYVTQDIEDFDLSSHGVDIDKTAKNQPAAATPHPVNNNSQATAPEETVRGIITNISTKTGNTNNKDWELTIISLDNGVEIITYDKDLAGSIRVAYADEKNKNCHLTFACKRNAKGNLVAQSFSDLPF
jgi:transposase-like protein